MRSSRAKRHAVVTISVSELRDLELDTSLAWETEPGTARFLERAAAAMREQRLAPDPDRSRRAARAATGGHEPSPSPRGRAPVKRRRAPRDVA